MTVLANAMIGVAQILNSIIFLVQILILARVVISWVSADRQNPLVSFIVDSTEPMLAPIRRKMPSLGMLDLSPLVLLFGVILLQYTVVHSLQDYARHIKRNAFAQESGVQQGDFERYDLGQGRL